MALPADAVFPRGALAPANAAVTNIALPVHAMPAAAIVSVRRFPAGVIASSAVIGIGLQVRAHTFAADLPRRAYAVVGAHAAIPSGPPRPLSRPEVSTLTATAVSTGRALATAALADATL